MSSTGTIAQHKATRRDALSEVTSLPLKGSQREALSVFVLYPLTDLPLRAQGLDGTCGVVGLGGLRPATKAPEELIARQRQGCIASPFFYAQAIKALRPLRKTR